MQPQDPTDREHSRAVADVRAASREIVRELGLLEGTFVPAGVTTSQCHALIELARAGVLTVGELAERLRLDKSVVSRVLAQLQRRRLVAVRKGANDRRHKPFALAAAGRRAVASIDASADERVGAALDQLDDGARARVLEGMAAYARALRRARLQDEVRIRPLRPEDDPAIARIIRAVMTEHGAVGAGFAIVDPEVSEMSHAYTGTGASRARYFVLERARAPRERRAVIGGAGYARLLGANEEICELRKMYLLPDARGGGLGRRLLAHVLDAAKRDRYRRCYLETMATMHRARALYESTGFVRLCGPEGNTGHYGCDAWYARAL